MKEIEWTPNDYSPVYIFTVDDKGGYVELLRVYDMPTDWPRHKEIEKTKYRIDYMAGKGFEEYKKQGDNMHV